MNSVWPRSTLGEVCRIVNGGTPKTNVAEYWDGDHRWITPAEMGKRTTPYIAESARTLTAAGLKNSSAQLLPRNSLILSSRAPIGYVVINTTPMAFNQGCKGLVPNTKLHHKFLYYFLTSAVDHLNDLGTGATFKEISAEKLKTVELPLPSQAEQERIVAILDETFAGIDAVIASTEKNIANARQFFESNLDLAFRSRTSAWESVRLSELLARGWITSHLDGNHGSLYPRKDEFVDEGVAYISARCLQDDRVNLALAKFLRPARADQIKKGVAKDRDVLFAHNATVGPVAVLKTQWDRVILSTSLTYYRCEQTRIVPEYLAHFMRSPAFVAQYREVMQQSTRNQVPISKQRDFIHLIPPLEEQQHLASRLDVIKGELERLAGAYRAKLGALSELKQSILRKAFAGELTAKELEQELTAA